MSYGAEKWQAGDCFAGAGSLRSAQATRFFALIIMVEAAELAARHGLTTDAIEHLRELQAHCEKMIGIVATHEKRRPRLVAA